MTIRRLMPEDVVEYRDLMLEAYARHPDAFTSTASERAALPMSWWQSRLDAAPVASEVVFGAFEHDRVIGVAGLSFATRDKIKHKATLFGMYVPPAFRRQGVGRELVLATLEHAKTRPAVVLVQLTVTQGNAGARALYERCGFEPFGVEPLAVSVGPEFVSKVHMWCDLRRHSSPSGGHAG